MIKNILDLLPRSEPKIQHLSVQIIASIALIYLRFSKGIEEAPP